MIEWFHTALYLAVMPFLRTGSFFRIMALSGVYSLPLFRAIVVVAGTALVAGTPAAATACRGQIGTGTIITGKTTYNPYNAAGIADSYQIRVTNTGDSACSYALIFRSTSDTPRLGGTLNYTLTDGGSTVLLTTASAATAPAARTKGAVAAGADTPLDFQIQIARGQLASPGPYQDGPALELYALDETGRLSGSPLQTTTLQITYTVERVLSVNIKGADTSTATVSFGTLTTGAVRTVEIQARSNLKYQFDVKSDNHGVLALTPKVAGQVWTVAYAATLGGQALDLANGASLLNLASTRPEADATFPLVVTIGDTARKRAGRYEDVITIEIKGAP